ncbi:MAG: hypothetical protein V1921_06590 [Candidatus Altiarchaeota archaeon]
MTGTKVIKLNLEDGGSAEKLPKLMDSGVEDVVKAFTEVKFKSVDEYYGLVTDRVRDFDVTQLQLQRVLNSIEAQAGSRKFFERDAGLFLTALIQTSDRDEFALEPTMPIGYLGHKLAGGKKITVKGNVGNQIGHLMQDGTVIIEGSAQNFTGYEMTGGEIIIKGDVGASTGNNMRGGKIHVIENAGDLTAQRMAGGMIEVDGKVGHHTGENMQAGTIKVKGDAGVGTGCGMEGGLIELGGNAGANTGELMRGTGKIIVNGKIESISSEYSTGEIWEGSTKMRPTKVGEVIGKFGDMMRKTGL